MRATMRATKIFIYMGEKCFALLGGVFVGILVGAGADVVGYVVVGRQAVAVVDSLVDKMGKRFECLSA